MPPKKRTINNSSAPENVTKMWKVSPPGPEQKELNRLFEEKTIDPWDTPNKIRLRFPMFQAFQTKTFALHFRKTKAKYGLNGNLHK